MGGVKYSKYYRKLECDALSETEGQALLYGEDLGIDALFPPKQWMYQGWSRSPLKWGLSVS
ncbi:MAG: hypothetical protein ACLTLQ_16515 [[Clostridium] scindens]